MIVPTVLLDFWSFHPKTYLLNIEFEYQWTSIISAEYVFNIVFFL